MKSFMEYAKAWVGLVVTGLASLISSALAEKGLGHVTGVEYLTAVVAMLLGFGGVAVVKNQSATRTAKGEGGHVDALLLIVAVVAFILGYLVCKVGN